VHHSPTHALLTERLLAAAGCVVSTLANALQLPESIDAFKPDLILSSIPIPHGSGAELAAIVRGAEAPRLVPVLFSAIDRAAHPWDEAQSGPAGADALTAKTLRPDLLVSTVIRRIASMRALPAPWPANDHLDPDTGLATRRHFVSVLGRALAVPETAGPGNGLLVVALDGVCRLNQEIGTGAADLATDQIGCLIAERLTLADLATRLDDHRHAILIRRPGAEDLEQVALALCGAITGARFQVAGNPLTVSVSIGIGLFEPAADDAVTMFKRAEHACAQALARGGNQTVINRSAAVQAQDESTGRPLVQLIERASNGTDKAVGFRILYQPILAVQHQGLRYVEVLPCLAAGDGALIPAADFMPVAERAGRTAGIDRWVMLRALAVLMQQGSVQPTLRLFIPQHVESLIQDGWLSWLRDQILAHGLAQRRPILCLQRQHLLKHHHLAIALTTLLRKIGVQVCLADVDDSQVSLHLVDEVRPQFVKLSPATVHQWKPERLGDLVQRLTGGGSAVIACGIDAAALVAPVWRSGVTYAQGAVIQLPQPDPVFDWGEVAAGQGG
jgi:diguanylate cyclase (GGDEF)-like protein